MAPAPAADTMVENLLNFLDTNHDQKISFDEFCTYLMLAPSTDLDHLHVEDVFRKVWLHAIFFGGVLESAGGL